MLAPLLLILASACFNVPWLPRAYVRLRLLARACACLCSSLRAYSCLLLFASTFFCSAYACFYRVFAFASCTCFCLLILASGSVSACTFLPRGVTSYLVLLRASSRQDLTAPARGCDACAALARCVSRHGHRSWTPACSKRSEIGQRPCSLFRYHILIYPLNVMPFIGMRWSSTA